MAQIDNATQTDRINKLARQLINDDILANQTALLDELVNGELLEGFPAVWIAPEDPVYEWWLVTRSLAEELTQIDEVVIENSFGRWWGRKATGQEIFLDGLFQRIAADLVKRWM